MKLNLGIVGLGEFSLQFLEIFLAHPDVERVCGAEMNDERREFAASHFGLKMYRTFEEMLEKDTEINCVAIFTQRHQHGPMAIAALKAGKHVFSTVPIGCTIEEIKEIVELTEKTGLTYMTAETCYYFPCAVFCRERYRKGEFGEFVYGESQYYHDITGMFRSFSGSGNPEWKKVAGIPPMYYATHSMSMLFSAIDDIPVEVSCFGYEDNENDDIYGAGKNHWDNPFSNETAVLKMSKGGIARINEFRRVGAFKPSSYITGIYGKKAIYEGSGMNHIFVHGEVNKDPYAEDVSGLINSFNYENNKDNINPTDGILIYKYHSGYSAVHNIERVPKEIRYIKGEHGYELDGHNGSHYLLVDDFCRAVVHSIVPPNNVWESATYAAAGIVAHESAMQNGKSLPIPFFGKAPENYIDIWEKNLCKK